MSESVETRPETIPVVTEPVPDLQLQLLIQLLDRELRSVCRSPSLCPVPFSTET